MVRVVSALASSLTEPEPPFSTVEKALDELRAGRFVVVVDDRNRKDQGDVTIAAEFVTPEAVNFMATHARGLVCLCLPPERCDDLELRAMPRRGDAAFGTAFTASIEARSGTTTGISAHDRARTIQVAADPRAHAADLVRPGHIFPLRAHPDGVLARRGHTEAAVDLARLSGLTPAAAVCAILDEDGDVARRHDLLAFCARHELSLVTVADVVAYRRRVETPDPSARTPSLLAQRDAFAGAAAVSLV